MSKKSGFTLIEILVVVAVIGLLVAILLPSLATVKRSAGRATCASNLKQVGTGLLAYLHGNNDRMPEVSFMPSVGAAPLTIDDPIYFADVLKSHLRGQMEALHCPQDQPNYTDRPAPNTSRSFFESERSSYEFRWRLNGLRPVEFKTAVGPPGHSGHASSNATIAPHEVWISRDYENFHGKAGQPGARRYVYHDGHVADYEN